jgi:hypothetical protein
MTDLLSGFSQALSIASRLREISKNIEDAEFKNLLADLSLELADAKFKISDLISENVGLREQIFKMSSAKGKPCPKCNNRSYELISTKPHSTFGNLGAKEHEYKCSSCDFTESEIVKP